MDIKRLVLSIFLYLLMGAFFYLLWYIYERKLQEDHIRKRIQSTLPSAWGAEMSGNLFSGQKKAQNLLERKLNEILQGNLGLEKPINLKLHRCGIKMSPEKFIILLIFCWGILFSTFNLFLFENSLKNLLLSTAIFFLMIYLVLESMEGRRAKLILSQLSPAIDIIARGIRSGGSLEKSFEFVVRETSSPLKEEFLDIARGLEFGMSHEKVLRTTARRINIPEFYFFSTALILQRQSGGSLSEVLNNIVLSINRLQEIQLKIKSLSAEAKASGYVLSAIPVLILLTLSQFRPEHITFFMETWEGRKLMLVALFLLGCGMYCIKRMTKIEV